MSSPSPDPDPHTTGLLDWLKSCGASFSSVNFPCLHPQLGYRCALAKEAIEPHQPIVGIPFGCMVCVPNCLRNPQDSLGVLLREMWLNQTLGGDGLLALCISREVKRGEASSFYPYLVFLIETAEPGTISKWSESEREELQDGVISKRAEERSESELRMHSRVVATIKRYAQQKDPDSYLDTSEALDGISAKLFVWSYHIIQARAFGRRLPWTSLVPLADCFNHANLPVRYALDTVGDGSVGGAKGCTTDPGEKAGTFSLFPSGGNRYARGCEIFNSYGRRNNSHLLLDYGFAMLENEWETVSVRISLTKGEAPAEITAYELRRAALRDLGYKSVRTVKLQRGFFVEDGLLMFRVANVGLDETGNALQHETLDLLKPVDKNVEIRALSGMMSVIREVGQGEWTTSIDEDKVELASVSQDGEGTEASFRKKSALEYRMTRKLIVSGVLQKLERAYLILVGGSEQDEEKPKEDPVGNEESRDERYEIYLDSIRFLANNKA